MAAESGGTNKPTKSTKATPKKPAKRTTAASRNPAKSASAAGAKPARSTARAKSSKSASAAKASKGASAAKPTRGTSAATTKRASAAKPARGARAAKAPSAVAEVKETLPASASARRAVVEGTARSYFDALAARDVEAAVRVWRDDAVDDVVPFGIFRGPAAIRGFLEETFGAMPDARFTVDRVIADEGGAAVRWRAVGTFSGEPFQGLEPTGSRIDLRGIDNLEIEDGMIVHNTGVFDGAAFARQIGLLPPEDSGADRAIRAGFNAVTKLRRSVAKRASG